MKGLLLLYNLKLNCLIFFYWSKQLNDYIYTNIYCKLLKCIGQNPCSYEHYLVKKFQKIFSPEGPRENVFPGSAVALDGSGAVLSTNVLPLPPTVSTPKEQQKPPNLPHYTTGSY